MTIIIDDLPDYDDIVIPSDDPKVTEIMNLALQEGIFQNPLASDLSASTTSASAVSALTTGTGVLTQSSIDDIIADLPLPDFDFTAADRTSLINSLNGMAESALPYGSVSGLVTDSLTRLTDHSNILSSGPGILSGAISQTLQTPSSILSDIPGGFPTDFPGVDLLDGIPPFPGLDAIDAIPSLNLSALPAIPSLPSLSDLAGVNLPGVPNVNDIFPSLGGSILSSDFGGVGGDLSFNSFSINSAALTGLGPMGSVATDVLSNITNTAALSALVPDASSVVNEFAPGLETLAPSFGDAGGAMGDMVSGEEAGIFGTGCSNIAGLSGAVSCESAAQAKGLASSVIETTKIQSGAKIVSSIGTDNLKGALGGFS